MQVDLYCMNNQLIESAPLCARRRSLGWFTAHLIKAEVRHRGANQCSHTFASQALSSYVPVEWVARQLGHSDTTMVKKHYGRWIPADTKSMASMVSEMMGF